MWQKGQSGNPTGRPKKEVSITSALRAFLEGNDETLGKPRNVAVAERLYALTRSDDEGVALNAIKHIHERIDGKVADQVSVNQTGKMVVEVVRVPGRAKSQD